MIFISPETEERDVKLAEHFVDIDSVHTPSTDFKNKEMEHKLKARTTFPRRRSRGIYTVVATTGRT